MSLLDGVWEFFKCLMIHLLCSMVQLRHSTSPSQEIKFLSEHQEDLKFDVEQVLIVTINDILQEPGQGYQFPGGSVLTFAEAPKVGDTCKILVLQGNW